MQCLRLAVVATVLVTVAVASEARAQIPLNSGWGLRLQDASTAVGKPRQDQLLDQKRLLRVQQELVSFLQVVEDDQDETLGQTSQSQAAEQTDVAKLLEESQNQMPDEADLAMVALAGEGTETQTSQAANELVQHLQVEKKDLQQKLLKQQEAVDKAKLEIRRRTESVRSLKARSADLEQQLSNMDKANTMKDQLMAEQQAHEVRKKQMAELQAEFDGKKQEASSMMQKYQNLVRKAKAAKALLAKEEKKAKEQAQKLAKDLDDERLTAREQATHDAASLETVKRHVRDEAENTQSDFKKQVELIKRKHEDEVNRAEQQILKEANIQKDQITAKVASYQRQLLQEETKEKTEASAAVAKEAELRQEMKKTKQEERKKLDEYHQEMKQLEQTLDEQKKVSSQKIEAARRDVQGLQREVLEEQEALKAKQAALQREQEQASEMMGRAAQEEKLEATKEKELQEKVKEALDMEEKGKLVLQRQAKAQVTKLRKMIFDEEALEKEQVEGLERQIAQANHTALAEVKSRSFLSKL